MVHFHGGYFKLESLEEDNLISKEIKTRNQYLYGLSSF